MPFDVSRIFRAHRYALHPETHERALAALPSPPAQTIGKSEGDLADDGHQGGDDPAEEAAKGFHTAAARVFYESHVRCQSGKTRPT